MKRKLNLSRKQKLKWISTGSVIIAAVLLMTSNSSYINDILMKINDNEIFFIGTDFENQASGDVINEGTVVFTGDIDNIGTFNCGPCETGVNYIRNELGIAQTIGGETIIKMQDIVLENTGGVDLELELQVSNSFDFKTGVLRTDRKLAERLFLHFLEGSVTAGTDGEGHVDGYVVKSGAGEFVMPIGDGTRLMPVPVKGTSPESRFKAAYYFADPNNGAQFPGGPFFTEQYVFSEIEYVSPVEFWDINGNTPISITLPWDKTSNVGSWTQNIDSIIVVGWDAAQEQWVSLGHVSHTGNLTNGTVTSNFVLPDDYQAYALGRALQPYTPVPYLSFDAIQKGVDGYLYWTTTNEKNVFYFDVERSIDGIIFEKFGMVQAGGNIDTIQNYHFWDREIALKDLDRVFYRLRQVDLDGNFFYSQVVELVFGDVRQIELVIYPNPADDILHVCYSTGSALDAKLVIINMLGQSVYQEALEGTGIYDVNVSRLASGHYVVLLGNDDLKANKRLVISR